MDGKTLALVRAIHTRQQALAARDLGEVAYRDHASRLRLMLARSGWIRADELTDWTPTQRCRLLAKAEKAGVIERGMDVAGRQTERLIEVVSRDEPGRRQFVRIRSGGQPAVMNP